MSEAPLRDDYIETTQGKKLYHMCWATRSEKDVADFKFWLSGETVDGEYVILVGVVEAESVNAAWAIVAQAFPDYQERWCVAKPIGWQPHYHVDDEGAE